MDHATHLPPLASAREISEDARAYILSGDEAGLSAAWRVLEARGCLCARAANEADLLKEFASCNKKKKLLLVDCGVSNAEEFSSLSSRLPGDVVTIVICKGADYEKVSAIVGPGAFMILRAPMATETLESVIDAALHEAGRRAALKEECQLYFGALRWAEAAKFTFRTLDEIEPLARLLSSAFPDQEGAMKGLRELMRNAVEHGNLEIGFKEKSRLLEDNLLSGEIARRLVDPLYGARVVEAVLARKPEGVYVIIKDQGAGFDWREFTKFSPSRAAYKNGRGIQIARLTCFDKLAFNEAGNQVTAFSALNSNAQA
ncbi:MAG TPA: ATP-binding protein [Parvularculaceae bacterium]|nr:ATP-binding protein [Amphiplicatus sp.]HPE31422.1 ATP-binding protein [Parvularculaceae bacterium]HRX38656.1 ATP-binding protein [Parvularculaceae bacterium]